MAVNFDKLIIDRVADAWFENSSNKLLAVLDDVQNFSVNTSSETKEKTDSMGALIKRYFTAKTVEVSGENAVLSLNLMGIQTGSGVTTDANVKDIPRILHVAKANSVVLPDVFAVDSTSGTNVAKQLDDTLIIYGTLENGLVDLDKQYVKDSAAAAGKYAVSVDSEGKVTIDLPTDATDSVIIKYQYDASDVSNAIRVDQDAKSFPKECKATFRVLCSDVCESDVVRAFYVVFPRFQMSPDFDWTVDTESAQSFSATALKDYCAKKQLLFYVVLDESSDRYDAILDENITVPGAGGNADFSTNSGF